MGIPLAEQLYFADRLLLLLTSCDKRRLEELEQQTWWRFSGAGSRSEAYGKFLADGLTRTLVAAKAREMSARTGGTILLQLLFDLSRPGGQADRVLAGPTNDVWIDPWLAHLRRLGVDYRLEHQVQAIHVRRGRVSGVTVVADGRGDRGRRRPLRGRAAGGGDADAGRRRAEGGRAAPRAACTGCARAG